MLASTKMQSHMHEFTVGPPSESRVGANS